MGLFNDTFLHKTIWGADGFSPLLGNSERILVDSLTTSSWTDISAVCVDLGETSISDHYSAFLEILVDGKFFVVRRYDWALLTPQSAGAAISEGNNTALRAYERDGTVGVYILVGRSEGGIPLIQQGAGINPTGAVRIELYRTEYDGGWLDFALQTTGQRQLICMQCDQDARPNPPPHGTDLRHNGREPVAAALSTGEVWYPSGRRIRSLTTKTWFAFGEAVYDNLLGVWKVSSAWYLADQSDRLAIQFGRNWDGPWTDSAYVVGAHRYARIRRADSSLTVRFIGVDGSGHSLRWVPLSEQYVDGGAYPYEPYTARLGFNLHPAEWDFLRFEWEWESNSDVVDGNTYYRRAEKIVSAQSVVGSPQLGRVAATRVTPKFGPTWFIRVTGWGGMVAERQSHYNTANDGFNALVQFESSDTTESEPITHIRFIERGTGQLSAAGWLRTFVR